MHDKFENIENSISSYMTKSRVLLFLQLALMIYFLLLKVYFMAVFNLMSGVVFFTCYKLFENKSSELCSKVNYYVMWLYVVTASCIMGMEYGFHLALIAMLLPVAVSIYANNGAASSDNSFFSCCFKRGEAIFIVAATMAAYLMLQVISFNDITFTRLVPVHSDLIVCGSFMLNALLVISYVFYYLNRYIRYVNKNEEFLKQKADYDELTGLYNRNRIRFILEHNYNVAKEGNMDFGIAIMDLDDFKKINDTYGHITGDFVLRRFAGIVDDIVKKCEGQIVAGRWGGEEFLVIYYGDNREDFYMLLEYIRMKICEKSFVFERNKINVSVTIGMALFGIEQSMEELINSADMKLYEGKKSGKNKVM